MLADAIADFLRRGLAAHPGFTGMVVECCPFDWGLNVHLRSATEAGDDVYDWRDNHAEMPEDQSFLDEICQGICSNEGDWARSFEEVVEATMRAGLALEEEGLLAGVDWWVTAQDDAEPAPNRARLLQMRAGTLEPGWATWLR